MKIGVNLKIDLDKVDQSAVYVGNKGRYLNVVSFIDIDNVGQFGDNGMITQDVGKDAKGAILGNSTIFWNDTQPLPPKQSAPQQSQAPQSSAPQAKDYTQDINTYWGLESDQARTAHWARLSNDVQTAILNG